MPALQPPIDLALAREERTLPGPGQSGQAYEAKLDGWRAAIHTAAGVVQSRSGKDLSRRFPELVAAGRELGDVVVDGEVVALREGRLDFTALQTSAASRRAAGLNVFLMAFDLLAAGDEDLRRVPYRHRRERLEQLLTTSPPTPVQLVPMTTDGTAALRWMKPEYSAVGIEGVVAKPLEAPYRGRAREWVKVRHKVVVDALVIGVTGTLGHPDALVLAQPDPAGEELHAVGLSVSVRPGVRAALAGQLHPTGGRRQLAGVVGGLPGHPGADYLPVEPTVLVEVEADPLAAWGAFRHRPRVLRIKAEL